MTAVATWSETLLATIGREALLASLLLLAVAPLARLLRGRAPVFVHALWALVLLRLVLPVGWAAPWSARALLGALPGWSGSVLGAETANPADEAILAALQPEAVTLPNAVQAGLNPPWLLGLAVLWLAGVAVSLGTWWWRRRRYLHLLAACERVSDPRLLATLERWRRRLGVRRSVRLVSAEVAVTPFTLGLFRPVIYLPRVLLARGDSAMLEAVVAHELAHVRRLDALWLSLQHWICALYFFHPVAWIASVRLIEARERLCDRMVLVGGTLSPRTYGRSLLAVLSLAGPTEFAAAPAFAAHSKHSTRRAKRRLTMRLTDLLHPDATTRPRVLLARAVVVLFALFLLPMAAVIQAADEVVPAQPTAASPESPATGASTATASGTPTTRSLINPLPEGGKITSMFGERKNPFTGERAHHRGVDVKAATGSAVVAAGDGVVEAATTRYKREDSWGTVVILDHGDGLKTFYSHLDSISVRPGQRVHAGDPIGGAGSTGKVTGPHLHFEVWEEGEVVDPAGYISDWR